MTTTNNNPLARLGINPKNIVLGTTNNTTTKSISKKNQLLNVFRNNGLNGLKKEPEFFENVSFTAYKEIKSGDDKGKFREVKCNGNFIIIEDKKTQTFNAYSCHVYLTHFVTCDFKQN